MDSKTFAIARCIAIVFLSLFISGMGGGPPLVGGLAPHFELKGIDGQTIKMSKLRGEFVVLNFWATWCVPCIKEMPELQKAHQSLKDKNLKIIAINFGESKTKVDQFVQNYGLSFPILLDRLGNTSEKYQILNLPVTYFITPDGIIRESIFGGGITQKLIANKIDQFNGSL